MSWKENVAFYLVSEEFGWSSPFFFIDCFESWCTFCFFSSLSIFFICPLEMCIIPSIFSRLKNSNCIVLKAPSMLIHDQVFNQWCDCSIHRYPSPSLLRKENFGIHCMINKHWETLQDVLILGRNLFHYFPLTAGHVGFYSFNNCCCPKWDT